jgi:hypothetical protein
MGMSDRLINGEVHLVIPAACYGGASGGHLEKECVVEVDLVIL